MIGAVLVWCGVAVVVASAIGALLPRDLLAKLHFLTPVTSVGAPLLGAGLGVLNGWGLTTATIVCVTILVFGTGPVLGAAIAHAAAHPAAPDRPPETAADR